jgi:hypothetical protein
MASFRTALSIPRAPFNIRHSDWLLCIGSCFAEHIAARLSGDKFPVMLNPTGIVYNPLAIRQCLDLVMSDKEFAQEDLFLQDELWHSFDHHGSFSHPDPELTLRQINETLFHVRSTLTITNRLILTLGTAFVFTHLPSGKIVSNCHKLPGQHFSKRRISVKETIDALVPVLTQLKSQNPLLEIIVTVSPVRYLRDGLIENQRSKATLLLALSEMSGSLDYVHYFPSYELVVDDLRDYRFYEADMAHPNKQAVDYIWDHFRHTYFDEQTKALSGEIEKIMAAVRHRPIYPGTTAHRQFAMTQLEKIKDLQQSAPYLDFSHEITALESVL